MPQVTAPVETDKRPKYKRRRRDTDDFGSLPTVLEREEGKAYKTALCNPLNQSAQKRAKKLWWQLEAEAKASGEKWTPSTRCPWCYTLRYNRPLIAPCAVCKHIREIGE